MRVSLPLTMFIQILLSALCILSIASTNVDNSTKELDTFISFMATPVKDEFDWRLLQQFTAAAGYKNVIISPVSLKLVLALLYEGAGGLTVKEFQKVLKFPADQTKLREEYRKLLNILVRDRQDYILNIESQLFLDNQLTVEQKFAAKALDFYQARVTSTNFSNTHEASNNINSWIEHLTNGRIKTLVSPDDLANTVLLAANAIYFKGQWVKPFPRSQTFSGDFYVSNSEVANVRYMTQSDFFHYINSDTVGAQILRLPYLGKKFSMFIILPHRKDGLSHLIDNMDYTELTVAMRFMERKNVTVTMPKLRFDFQSKYSEILRRFGFDTLFHGISSFPGIVRDQGVQLVVTDILQKSGIDITEEGSVLYAATQVQLTNKFGDEPSILFNAIHPFLFFIQEEITHNILFIGKVENPLDYEATPSRYGDIGPVNKPVTSTEPNQNNSPPQQYNPTPSGPNQNNPMQGQHYPSLTPSDSNQNNPIYGQYNPPLTPSVSNQNIPQNNPIGSHFDINLLKNSIGSSKNILISPSSVKIALAMLAEAAVGRTADEIYDVIGIPVNRRHEVLNKLINELNETVPNSVLKFKNALFVSEKQRLKENYKQTVEGHYGALIKKLDFYNRERAAAEINEYIKHATSGFIPTALSPDEIEYTTNIILTNVLYFKADWLKFFEKKLTKPSRFHSPRGLVDVQLMHIIEMYDYGQTPHAHVVKLDYTGFQRAMLLLIPKDVGGLAQALRDFEKQSFEDLLATLKHTEIELYLPKFEINYGQNIIDILKKMGIKQVFESNSNLSNLLEGDKQNLVDSFLHKTKIEVTEEGTEASALSLVSVIPLMGSSTPNVRADRPFAFFIYNTRTNNILFEGVLNEPENKVITQEKTVTPPPYTYSQAVRTQGRNSFPAQQSQQTLTNRY